MCQVRRDPMTHTQHSINVQGQYTQYTARYVRFHGELCINRQQPHGPHHATLGRKARAPFGGAAKECMPRVSGTGSGLAIWQKRGRATQVIQVCACTCVCVHKQHMPAVSWLVSSTLRLLRRTCCSHSKAHHSTAQRRRQARLVCQPVQAIQLAQQYNLLACNLNATSKSVIQFEITPKKRKSTQVRTLSRARVGEVGFGGKQRPCVDSSWRHPWAEMPS